MRARHRRAIQTGDQRIAKGSLCREIAANFSARKLSSVKINIGAALPKIAELCGQRRPVAFGRVPLAAEAAAHSAAEWRVHRVIGIVVIERTAKETPDDTRIDPWRGAGTGVNVCQSKIVIRVAGLRPGDIDVINRRGKRQSRFRRIDLEPRRTE